MENTEGSRKCQSRKSSFRFRELKKFIPVGHTVRDELIDQGLLEVVPLTPKGRAKGVTLESIIKYQKQFMGIEPLSDEAAETAQPIERYRVNRNT